jgi:hypothetical protein
MHNKPNTEKDESLSQIQEAIDKKVEDFMGAPPEEKVPVPNAPVAKDSKDDMPGAPPISAGTVIAPDKPEATEAEAEVPEEIDDDPETDEAVNDIAAEESDEVLAAEDEVNKAFESQKPGWKEKIKDFFAGWWANKKARYATIAALVVILFALILAPVTRYFFLNSVGIRSSTSLAVVDDATQLPLKNVQVSLGGQSGTTDSDGKMQLAHLKLGASQLVVQKAAFAPVKQKVTVGWGSNPLGNFSLKAVGAQYSFVVTDWLTGKPIEKAEASAGDADAVSDKNGKILLTVDTTDEQDVKVTVKADTYRDEIRTVPITTKDPQAIAMVPGRKQAFVSKRSGKYDVYKIDVDGKNEALVLRGTGYERDDIALVPHPSAEEVALVSTRDNVHNTDGFLLSTLTLIDLSDNSTVSLGQSERIQIVGWIDDRLIYVQVAAGASATNPKRNRLMSYDYKTNDKKELASSNAFNDVVVAAGSIYYAPSSSYANQGNVYLFKVNADGTNQQTALNKETWNIFRVGYNEFNLSVGQDWYDYKLSDNKPAAKLPGQPADLLNRVYIDSPDKKHSLWVDNRDGKGVLLSYDTAAKTDKVLMTQSGLKYPIHWLTNNTVVYRIQTDQETADYVLNTDGGTAHKIKDVTNSAGVAQWYYY